MKVKHILEASVTQWPSIGKVAKASEEDNIYHLWNRAWTMLHDEHASGMELMGHPDDEPSIESMNDATVMDYMFSMADASEFKKIYGVRTGDHGPQGKKAEADCLAFIKRERG